MGGIQVFTTEDGLYDNIITALTTDIWGRLWVGTLRGGLAMFTEGTVSVYDYDDGLHNVSVQSLASDRVGNIWIGTLEVLYFLRQEEGIVRPVIETLYTPVTSVFEDKNGVFWIGTDTGLFRVQNGKAEKFRSPAGQKYYAVSVLLESREGSLLVGIRDEILSNKDLSAIYQGQVAE